MSSIRVADDWGTNYLSQERVSTSGLYLFDVPLQAELSAQLSIEPSATANARLL